MKPLLALGTPAVIAFIAFEYLTATNFDGNELETAGAVAAGIGALRPLLRHSKTMRDLVREFVDSCEPK